MTTDTSSATYCVNHPGRETGLTCKNCGKPICPDCAVRTPTGYSCKDCIRGRQKKFITAKWYDYPLAVVVAGVLAYIGGFILSFVGGFFYFYYLAIIIGAPVAGGIIAEAVRRVVGRRRSKLLFQLAAASVVVGGFLPSMDIFLYVFAFGGLEYLIELIWPAIFAAIAAGTVYYRLSGIRIG